MLPTNFACFRNEYPSLRAAFDELEGWIRKNPHLNHIDVRRVATERPELNLVDMAVALAILDREGILRREYAVVAPTNHALADDFYGSLEEIPDEMYDTAEDCFRTDDAEIVPVFVESPR